MKTQELQLVNFEQAKRLSISGFDYPVKNMYWNAGTGFYKPTVALALEWCRDVKKIDCSVGYFENYFFRCSMGNRNFVTYELAESALLDELLTLIEKEK